MDNRRYLYHARINRHLTLEQVGVRTALSPTVLRHIDEGRFELLPSGLYARAYVRAFAGAVGLEPEAALGEVEQFLPGTPDPVAMLNEVKGSTASERLSRAIAGLAARWSPFQRQAAPSEPVERQPPSPDPVECPAMPSDPVDRWPALVARRLEQYTEAVAGRTATWRGATVDRLQTLGPQLTRCSAAAIDALLLLAVDGFLVLLISWSSGLDLQSLLQDAGWALGSFCAMPIALYFLLFGGICGSTLGRYACSLMEPSPGHPLTLPDILRRAVLR